MKKDDFDRRLHNLLQMKKLVQGVFLDEQVDVEQKAIEMEEVLETEIKKIKKN
jgi:hypothetical protein